MKYNGIQIAELGYNIFDKKGDYVNGDIITVHHHHNSIFSALDCMELVSNTVSLLKGHEVGFYFLPASDSGIRHVLKIEDIDLLTE
jgi:hypothetical protein